MRKEAENWWKQAEADLKKAEVLCEKGLLDGAAFYCQQATEKSLKYLLVKTKRESYPIHSLIKLGKLAGVPKEFEDFLKNLTKEYYLPRYPDVTEDAPFEMYDQIEISNVVKKTKEFLKWINVQTKR